MWNHPQWGETFPCATAQGFCCQSGDGQGLGGYAEGQVEERREEVVLTGLPYCQES